MRPTGWFLIKLGRSRIPGLVLAQCWSWTIREDSCTPKRSATRGPANREPHGEAQLQRRSRRPPLTLLKMSESAVGAPVRQTQRAFCLPCELGKIARDMIAADCPQKNAPGTRTGLIGGPTPRGPLSTLTDEALKTAAAGRTASAAWSALSPGVVAHCRKTICEKLGFMCRTGNSCAKARRKSREATQVTAWLLPTDGSSVYARGYGSFSDGARERQQGQLLACLQFRNATAGRCRAIVPRVAATHVAAR